MNNFGAQNMVLSLKKVLMKKPQKFMSKININKWSYHSILNQNLVDKNYKDFSNIIKNSGAEIIELKLEDEKEELCDSIYTHDPSLVLNKGAIILCMGKPPVFLISAVRENGSPTFRRTALDAAKDCIFNAERISSNEHIWT